MYVMYEFVRACDTSICIVIYALDTCVFVCVFQICYLCMTLWIWSHHTCTWWVESCVSARANAQIYNRGNVQGCGRICVYMHTDTDTATYIHASACIRIGYSNILLYAASTHSHVTSIVRIHTSLQSAEMHESKAGSACRQWPHTLHVDTPACHHKHKCADT